MVKPGNAVARLPLIALALSLLIANCAEAGPDAAGPGAAPAGTWDVVQVAVDGADQPHWQYRPDEPALLYRELAITAATVEFDDNSRACRAPAWQSGPPTKPGAWVGREFLRPAREGNSLPATPTLAEFSLKLADTEAASFALQCEGKVREPWNQAKFLLLPDHRLLMKYGSQALLVLQPRDPGAPIRASFDCQRAQSPTEKALCSDPVLAGYDRSIAAAFQWHLKTADDAVAFRRQQQQWLKERDACGADAACLRSKMSERLDPLASNW